VHPHGHQAVLAAAADTQGVLSRHMLLGLGVTDDHVRNEVAARRWRTIGTQTVVVHTGPIGTVARRWSAVWEIGTGIVAPSQLVHAAKVAMGRRRRAFLSGVVADVCSGVLALGELDFARMCRRRGLPEPARQVLRQAPGGRAYLDVVWDEQHLAVEVSGSHHRQGLAVTRWRPASAARTWFEV
jgi:hypothetical protein